MTAYCKKIYYAEVNFQLHRDERKLKLINSLNHHKPIVSLLSLSFFYSAYFRSRSKRVFEILFSSTIYLVHNYFLKAKTARRMQSYVITYPFALSADGCFLFIFDKASTKGNFTLPPSCISKRAKFGTRCACVDSDSTDQMNDCTADCTSMGTSKPPTRAIVNILLDSFSSNFYCR